ncbi:hypothetical protein diail_7421 [Diaporthe ilicicola]|nr:hypothetical protein diail_7421 [Diaporthe ilicicola]
MKRKRAEQRRDVVAITTAPTEPVGSPTSSPPISGHRRRLQLQSIHRRLKDVENRHNLGFQEILDKAKQKTRQTFHRRKETVACVSCYDDFAHYDIVRLSCQHSYCKKCFHQLILNALKAEEHWPPRCCADPIDHKICLKSLPKPFPAIYKEKRQEYETHIKDRYYCPALDCGLHVPPDKTNTPYRRARCKSKHETCMDCREAAHADAVDCVKNRDMELVQVMAIQQGWRRCHRCQTMIEHRTACRHIKCRCGAEFCYVCGAKWWTCGCTERQLRDLKKSVKQSQSTLGVQGWSRDSEDARAMSEAQQLMLDEETALWLASFP